MSNNAKIDSNQVLPAIYDKDSEAIKVTGLGKLVTASFDYLSFAYPDAVTDVVTYKLGGSGGSTVATVTIIYTDSTKADISSVTKS